MSFQYQNFETRFGPETSTHAIWWIVDPQYAVWLAYSHIPGQKTTYDATPYIVNNRVNFAQLPSLWADFIPGTVVTVSTSANFSGQTTSQKKKDATCRCRHNGSQNAICDFQMPGRRTAMASNFKAMAFKGAPFLRRKKKQKNRKKKTLWRLEAWASKVQKLRLTP